MMPHLRRPGPAALLAWSVAVAMLAVVGPGWSPPRIIFSVPFLLIAPGWTMARAGGLSDVAAVVGVATIGSAALDTLIATAFLYSGHWSPVAITLTVCFLTGALAIVPMPVRRLQPEMIDP